MNLGNKYKKPLTDADIVSNFNKIMKNEIKFIKTDNLQNMYRDVMR